MPATEEPIMSARLSLALLSIMAASFASAQTAPTTSDQAGGTSGLSATQGTGGSPGTPAAAPNALPSGNAPSVPDALFVREASASGMAEVSLGKLGADKGQSPAVKQFGQQMVTDHTKANAQLI